MTRTTLDGFFNVTRPLVMPMVRRRWGRIVNISSVSGVIGNRGQVNYSAAKAGLIGATLALAKEVAHRGVTVNAVAPGLIETDMIQGAPIEEILKFVPARRVGTPRGGGEPRRLPRERRGRVHHGPGHRHQRRARLSAGPRAGERVAENRVVITGVGLTSPIGNSIDEVSQSLRRGRRGRPRHAALRRLLRDEDPARRAGRRRPRRAAEEADAHDGTRGAPLDLGDRSRPSTTPGSRRSTSARARSAWRTARRRPSSGAVEDYVRKLLMVNRTVDGIQSATYLEAHEPHLRGEPRRCTSASAGASSPRAPRASRRARPSGTATRRCGSGVQETMICGGAEELDVVHAAVFDVMFATSTPLQRAAGRDAAAVRRRPRRPRGGRGRRDADPRELRAGARPRRPDLRGGHRVRRPTATATT